MRNPCTDPAYDAFVFFLAEAREKKEGPTEEEKRRIADRKNRERAERERKADERGMV